MIDLFACCRLCLKQDETVTVNCPDITELCTAVKNVFGFKIARNDKCTTKLCRECTHKVTTFSMYRDTVISNQKSLKQYILLNDKISKNPDVMVKAEEKDDDVIFVAKESTVSSSPTKTRAQKGKDNNSTSDKNLNLATVISVHDTPPMDKSLSNTKGNKKRPPKLFARKRTSAPLQIASELMQKKTKKLKVKLCKINYSQLNKYSICRKDRNILLNDIIKRKEKYNKRKLQSELLTPFGAKVLQNLMKTKPSTSSGVGTIQELISSVTKQQTNKTQGSSIRELLVKATNEGRLIENSPGSMQAEQTYSISPRVSSNRNNIAVPSPTEFNISRKESSNSRHSNGPIITKVHANIQNISNLLTPMGSRMDTETERNRTVERSTNSFHMPQQNNQNSNLIYINSNERPSSSFTNNRSIMNQPPPSYSNACASSNPPIITGVYASGPHQMLPILPPNNVPNNTIRNNPLLLQQLSRTPSAPFEHAYNRTEISVATNQPAQTPRHQMQPQFQPQVPYQHQMMSRLPARTKISATRRGSICTAQEIPVSVDEYLPMEDVLGRSPRPEISITATSNSQVTTAVTSTTATPPPPQLLTPNLSAIAESNNVDTRVKVLSVKELNMRAAESKKLPIRITLVKIKNEVQIKLTDSKNNDLHYKDLTTPEQMAVKSSLLEPQSRQHILNAIRTCNPDQYSRNMLRCFGITADEMF